MYQSVTLNEKTNKYVRVLLLQSTKGEDIINIGDLSSFLGAQSDIITINDYSVATSLLRTSEFDIVIIDLCEQLSEDILNSFCRLAGRAKVIALSDKNSVSSTLSAMQAGAHDIIAKPIDYKELDNCLKKLSLEHGNNKHLNIAQNMIGVGNNNALGINAVEDMSAKPVKPMWQQEQKIIEDAILLFNGNIASAAKALEISPSTIYRKRQSWGEFGSFSAISS
ncbi:MAG: hypothetical protein L3J15_02810 [Devosiaceae bacterium]|nr:hypothetical protein [Devosiaceae bacterium]